MGGTVSAALRLGTWLSLFFRSDPLWVQGAPPSLEWWEVPALSDVRRMFDTVPWDGIPGGAVRVIAAQGEYEPASFVLRSDRMRENVRLSVSDLTQEDGHRLSADRIDLRVVKVWYQNGNAWHSYFADPGSILVPELLLHDENLIRVDRESRANYARLDEPSGPRYVWISAPRELDTGFDPFTAPFADASTLQPVTLLPGEFKQLWLTVQIPPEAKPGLYRGEIVVSGDDPLRVLIPLLVRVLPFELPLPRSYFDLDRPFLVTLMGAWPPVPLDHPAMRPILRNLRAHNVLHLDMACRVNMPEEEIAGRAALVKEMGFETRPVFLGWLSWVGAHDGTPLTFDELMSVRRETVRWRQLCERLFGHTEGIVGLGDEQGAAWVAKTRPIWRLVHEQGLRSELAGHRHYLVKAGHMLDVYPAAVSPSDLLETRPWNAVGHTWMSFYANQHTGVENPAFVRRQHGLLGYLSDFSMVNNYEFAYGPWNDWVQDLYKPMVLAYPTCQGLVDTLAWEGFREAIDDIRYATLLKTLAQAALRSGDLDRIYAGRKALLWLALVNGATADLNAVRLEMIRYILLLRKGLENGG